MTDSTALKPIVEASVCSTSLSLFLGSVSICMSEALVAERVPETLTKEKQKLIINTSSCEQDNCESVAFGLQPNRRKATDNSKCADNLEELDIKEHVKNV